jgi:tetratricopeptide (TPR) repeat protein
MTGLFALLLEITAWSGGAFLGEQADYLLLWYLVLHGAASLLVGIFAIQLLPSIQPRRSVMLIMAGCSYAAPLFGFVGVLISIVVLRAYRRHVAEPEFESLKLPEFDPHQHTTGGFRQSGLRSFLNNGKAPTSSRISALVALQYVSGRVSTPLLRDVLTDPSEDIRLLAYGMLDNQEKRINQAIDVELKKLAHSREEEGGEESGPNTLAAARRLSDLYWELNYRQLVQGDLRTYALAESSRYCQMVLRHTPDDAALTLRQGRLLHDLGQAEAAVAAYQRALALGLPATRVLPYLAELRFDQGNYADVRRLMTDLANWTALPRLQPVIKYWNSQ